MDNKNLEKASQEVAKWEKKAEDLTSQIEVKNRELQSLKESLGEVVISGGDVSKVQKAMDGIQKDLDALSAGLQAALVKENSGRVTLAQAEREFAQAQVQEIKAQGNKIYDQIIAVLEDLSGKEKALAELAQKADGLLQVHGLQIHQPHYFPFWEQSGEQDKTRAGELKERRFQLYS